MKIAYLIPHFQLYGGIRRILTLTNELSKRHEVFVIPENGDHCDWMRVDSKIEDLNFLNNNSWDAVIFSLESQYKIPLSVRAKAKIHYILHYGPMYKDTSTCVESYRSPYYKIANSTWTAKMLSRHLGHVPPVVLGGIDRDIFYPKKTDKLYDVLTYGDKRREWKGRGDVEVIQYDKPEWSIGYMYDVNPRQSDISYYYNSAKVFFSASWFEGWNWMGIEAMACGTPLVITADGGSSDYVEPGKNCIVVPPRNPRIAMEAIDSLLKNGKMRRSLSKEGLKTASKFTWEKSAKDFELQIEKALCLKK